MDLPVGIDLIEFKKAASFYRTHRNRLHSFFTDEEADFIRHSAKPHESLALLLAAKEAVFKTLRSPWMGNSGFRSIQIIPAAGKELSFKLKGRFKKFSSLTPHAKIVFMKHKHYVVAHCSPEAVSPCAGI